MPSCRHCGGPIHKHRVDSGLMSCERCETKRMPRLYTYGQVKRSCAVRSSIRRYSKPHLKYPKNHDVPFDERVPLADQLADDWEEYDPREHDECSEYNEFPA